MQLLVRSPRFWLTDGGQDDGGHPNWNVIRLEAMNSSECDRDVWNKIEDQ